MGSYSHCQRYTVKVFVKLVVMWIPVDHKYYFLQIWGLTEKSLTHWDMYASVQAKNVGHFRWLGSNVWWEISQIYIEHIKPIRQMSDEPWKFFANTDASENLAIIGLENGMSPVQCQAIIRTNAGMLLSHWSRDKMTANFPDDIFRCIFLNENVWISIKI